MAALIVTLLVDEKFKLGACW